MFEKANKVAPDDERGLSLLPMVYRGLGQDDNQRSASRRRLTLAEQRLEFDPDDVQTLLDGSLALAALGERERSMEWARRVLDLETEDALVLYNLGCFFSLAGEADQALGSLERSYEAGLADPDWMRQDSDLDNIREDPRFQALLARMEAGS